MRGVLHERGQGGLDDGVSGGPWGGGRLACPQGGRAGALMQTEELCVEWSLQVLVCQWRQHLVSTDQ